MTHQRSSRLLSHASSLQSTHLHTEHYRANSRYPCHAVYRFPTFNLNLILYMTLIFGPIHVDVHSVTVSFIVLPITVINVTISMNQLTLSRWFVLDPLPLVDGPIRPFLFAETVPEAVLPLTIIYCSWIQSNGLYWLFNYFTGSLFLSLEPIVVRMRSLFSLLLAMLTDWLLLGFYWPLESAWFFREPWD